MMKEYFPSDGFLSPEDRLFLEKKPDPKPAAAVPSAPPVRERPSYLAPDTAFTGIIHSEQDLEIGGTVQGNVSCGGCVTLRSDFSGDVSAVRLDLIDCAMTGNIQASDWVALSKNASLRGDIHAKTLICSGKIDGDLQVTAAVSLLRGAEVNGDIHCASMDMAQGVILQGTVDVSPKTSE